MASMVRGLAVALAAAAMGCGAAQAQQLTASIGAPGPAPTFVPGEIIVGYKNTQTSASRANVLAAVPGATVKEELLLPRTEVVSVPVGEEEAAVAALSSNPAVAFVEVNGYVHADAVPNDTRFGDLWGLNNVGQVIQGVPGIPDADIDAVEAWNLAAGVANTPLVAVIDTGIAYNHPDLANHVYINPGESGGGKETNGLDDDGNGFVDDWHGYNFISNNNNAADDNEHGTHVSGTIAGISNNGFGVAGVASFPGPGIWGGPKILPVKALNASGSGTFAQIINAMTYAGKMHAVVANMSLGGTGTNAGMDAVIQAYPNTLYVVAAGNDGEDVVPHPHTPCVPAALPDAANKLCVAATDNRDGLASFSNYSAVHVDLGAPGVSVLSSVPQSTLFLDDFETSIAGRYVLNDAGQTGTNFWERSTGFATSGSSGLADSPAGQYAINSNTWARLANTVNETGGSSCTVEANVKWDYLTGDTFYVDVSANGTVWASGTFNGPRNVPAGHMTVLLGTAYSGLATLYIRLRFFSNASGTADGTYLDDLTVRCIKSTQDASSFSFFDGTSMATPHVAGAAAFLFAKFPTATVAQVKDKLLRSVDKLPSLAGKTVTGGRLNLYQAAAESSLYRKGTKLYFFAGRGETNNIAVTLVKVKGVPYYLFSDPYAKLGKRLEFGSRIVPGKGCVSVTDTSARCAVLGITQIQIFADNLNDTVTAKPVTIPVKIDGGDGDDILTGGKAGDILVGGRGRDRFVAREGNDTIKAWDNEKDLGFNCGEDLGDIDTVQADLSPNDPIVASPTNCEVVVKKP